MSYMGTRLLRVISTLRLLYCFLSLLFSISFIVVHLPCCFVYCLSGSRHVFTSYKPSSRAVCALRSDNINRSPWPDFDHYAVGLLFYSCDFACQGLCPTPSSQIGGSPICVGRLIRRLINGTYVLAIRLQAAINHS